MLDSETKAIFFDRDGVVNIDYGYVHDPLNFQFAKHFVEGCIKLLDLGFYLFIVTNQSGIGRGYFTIDEYDHLTEYYLHKLRTQGVVISEVVYCPHIPDDLCKCRKPKSKLVDELCEKYSINKSNSAFVGDNLTDMECARRANLQHKFLILPEETAYPSGDYHIGSDVRYVAKFFSDLKQN